MIRLLTAMIVACTLLHQVATAAPLEDALLSFNDTKLVAEGSYSIFWVSNTSALVNAKRNGDLAADTDVVLYDIQTGRSQTIVEHAWLRCWAPAYGFGVVQKAQGTERTSIKVEMLPDGRIAARDELTNPSACSSIRFDITSRGRQYDLGKGNGIIEINKPLNPTVATYVQESGRRVDLVMPGAIFGKPKYYEWRNAYRVGKMADGRQLYMDSNGNIEIDEKEPPVYHYFTSPHPVPTRHGYIVHTGARDRFNGDTFFLGNETAPVRIYRSKGFNDQLGSSSVGPDGCYALLSMAETGLLGRLQAISNIAKNTLHWTNVCTLPQQQ